MKKRVNLQRSVLVLAVSQALVSYSLATSILKVIPSLVLMPRSQAKVENPSIKTDNNTNRTNSKIRETTEQQVSTKKASLKILMLVKQHHKEKNPKPTTP